MADGAKQIVVREGPADPFRPDAFPPAPSGAKGGGKGGGSSQTFHEAPDDLRSEQTVRLIDLLGEGPIVGPVNDPAAPNVPFYSVAFDGVRVANPNGSRNFTLSQTDIRFGTPGQALLSGFPSAESETLVGAQVKHAIPIVRSIVNLDADRVRFTVSVPSLSVTNPKGTSTNGTSVSLEFYIQNAGGGWQKVGAGTIAGKSSSKYQRAYVFKLPAGGPWDIRVNRVTADSTSQLLQNDTFWDSFSVIIDTPLNFNMSAVYAWQIQAAQFSNIPTRSYHLDGRIISVPNNYSPSAATYDGSWDGGFIQAWTSNPAWILYDMLTNRRYGLGRYLDPTRIDKFKLYSIGRYCDGAVPDGRGGFERRYSFNGVIVTAQDAFTMINTLCACFRGSAFWDGGMLSFLADMPADPIALYTNANVINGDFVYAGADISARHNQILIKWQDPNNFGDERIALAEDQPDIALRGIRPDTIDGQGVISEGLATRYGRWQLYVETHEGETVSFALGLNGISCRPGDVIEIADRTKAGHRRGGRLLEGTTAAIVRLDAPADLIAGEAPVISAMIEDDTAAGAHVETVTLGASADQVAYAVTPAFSAAPAAGTVYVVSSGELAPSTWRVTSVKEGDSNSYDVTAIAHNPSKYDYIEQDIALSTPQISNFPSVSVINMRVTEDLVQLSSISVAARMSISWQSDAAEFDVDVQAAGQNTDRYRVNTTQLDVPAVATTYRIRVTPIASTGFRGQYTEVTYTVIGLTAPPADVQLFRVSVKGSTGFFAWQPATDLDVIIGGHFEIRYSPSNAVDWNSSTIVLESISGAASTVEIPYRAGLYLIKAVDASGNYSVNAATLETAEFDQGYTSFYRFCESPDWQGALVGTAVQMPQEWLVLGTPGQGGAWDEQLANMDTWPDVDVLVEGNPAPGEGYYYFDQVFDVGGVFPVRLTLDMFAFPVGDETNFIDSRESNMDSWADFDNSDAGVIGNVQVFISSTQDDPAGMAPAWSDWQVFMTGTYTARAFRFYAYLTAAAGQNVAVETLCVLADLENKADSGGDIPWHGVKIHIAFTIKFYTTPAVVVTLQQPRVGDHMRISNKTNLGFDIELLDSTNAYIPDGIIFFDWHAMGY